MRPNDYKLVFGRVKRKLRFSTLFKVEMGCLFLSTKKEARIRHLCLFAEAMYAYIFGAFEIHLLWEDDRHFQRGVYSS